MTYRGFEISERDGQFFANAVFAPGPYPTLEAAKAALDQIWEAGRRGYNGEGPGR